MESLLRFGECACGWILLLGVLLALALLTWYFVWVAYKEWKAARRAEKADAEEIKRCNEIAARVNKR